MQQFWRLEAIARRMNWKDRRAPVRTAQHGHQHLLTDTASSWFAISTAAPREDQPLLTSR